MALRRLDAICDALLAAGLDPATPAAAVQSGTLPGQRVVVGLLGGFAALVRAEKVESPAMIVIGGVVGMRGKLAP